MLHHTPIEFYGFAKKIKGNWGYFQSNHFTEYITLVNFRYIIFSSLLTQSLTVFVDNY